MCKRFVSLLEGTDPLVESNASSVARRPQAQNARDANVELDHMRKRATGSALDLCGEACEKGLGSECEIHGYVTVGWSFVPQSTHRRYCSRTQLVDCRSHVRQDWQPGSGKGAW